MLVVLKLDEVAIADGLQGEAAASGFTNECLCIALGRFAQHTTESIGTIESRVTSATVLKDDNLITGPGCGFVLTIFVTRVTRVVVAVITFYCTNYAAVAATTTSSKLLVVS